MQLRKLTNIHKNWREYTLDFITGVAVLGWFKLEATIHWWGSGVKLNLETYTMTPNLRPMTATSVSVNSLQQPGTNVYVALIILLPKNTKIQTINVKISLMSPILRENVQEPPEIKHCWLQLKHWKELFNKHQRLHHRHDIIERDLPFTWIIPPDGLAKNMNMLLW